MKSIRRNGTWIAIIIAASLAQLGSSAAFAQTTNRPSEVVIALGTAGGPPPQTERAGISTLVQVNGKSYLFDAGDGFTRQLTRAGISLLDVQHIFLTHLHDDHYAGLGAFLGQLWTLRPSKPVHIYGPSMTNALTDGVRAFHSVNSIVRAPDRSWAPPTLVSHESGPSLIYQDENIKVTAVENSHFHFPSGSPPAGKTTSFSYRIETPTRSIVITGDTGNFPGFAEFARNADLMITEVIDADEVLQLLQSMQGQPMSPEQYERRKFHMEEEHVTPESIAKIAKEANVKKVVMTHFQPRTTGDVAFTDFESRVRKEFSGEVVSARDLSRF